jgi:hypothetical protein
MLSSVGEQRIKAEPLLERTAAKRRNEGLPHSRVWRRGILVYVVSHRMPLVGDRLVGQRTTSRSASGQASWNVVVSRLRAMAAS